MKLNPIIYNLKLTQDEINNIENELFSILTSFNTKDPSESLKKCCEEFPLISTLYELIKLNYKRGSTDE